MSEAREFSVAWFEKLLEDADHSLPGLWMGRVTRNVIASQLARESAAALSSAPVAGEWQPDEKAVAKAIMNEFVKKWFWPVNHGPIYFDHINGEMAWLPEARAAIALSRNERLAPQPDTDRCDCENPEPASGVALVSEDCPIHGRSDA